MRGSLPNLVVLVSVSSSQRPSLSVLERRVLRLVVLGYNRREIGTLLDRSVDAIRQCQADLKHKARTTTLRGLARWARRTGLGWPGDRLSQLERSRLDRFRQPVV